ncbi:MAG: hypothetical protein AAF085_15600, partial [Planctomycetota bacterium]
MTSFCRTKRMGPSWPAQITVNADSSSSSSPGSGRLRSDASASASVLKALEREPERRYGSAEALARDVQR